MDDLAAVAREIRRLEAERRAASARECDVIVKMGKLRLLQLAQALWRELNGLPAWATLPPSDRAPATDERPKRKGKVGR